MTSFLKGVAVGMFIMTLIVSFYYPLWGTSIPTEYPEYVVLSIYSDGKTATSTPKEVDMDSSWKCTGYQDYADYNGIHQNTPFATSTRCTR